MRHISEERLNAWLDGALSPEEMKTVNTHLRECSACGKAANELKRLCEALDGLPSAPDCPYPARDTMAAWRREREQRSFLPGILPWWLSWKIMGYAAMVAGLVLGVVLGSQFNHSVGPASESNNRWIAQVPDDSAGEPNPYVNMLLSDEGGGL